MQWSNRNPCSFVDLLIFNTTFTQKQDQDVPVVVPQPFELSTGNLGQTVFTAFATSIAPWQFGPLLGWQLALVLIAAMSAFTGILVGFLVTDVGTQADNIKHRQFHRMKRSCYSVGSRTVVQISFLFFRLAED